MKEFLPFIISGIATGAIYGIAGTGLVLTYKTSGIFNFAQGAVATGRGVRLLLPAPSTTGWTGCRRCSSASSWSEHSSAWSSSDSRPASRRSAPHSRSWAPSASCCSCRRWPPSSTARRTLRVDAFLPGGRDRAFTLFDVVVSWDRVIVAAISVVAVAALYALFRYTRLGVSMRAVVDDPDLVPVHGTNPVASGASHG